MSGWVWSVVRVDVEVDLVARGGCVYQLVGLEVVRGVGRTDGKDGGGLNMGIRRINRQVV